MKVFLATVRSAWPKLRRDPFNLWLLVGGILAVVAIVAGALGDGPTKLQPPPTPPLPAETGPTPLVRIVDWVLTPCTETMFPAWARTQWHGRMLKIRSCPTIGGESRQEYYVEMAGGWQRVTESEFHR